jgi:alpha-glucosidase
VLAFRRESGLACLVNLGIARAPLSAYREILLASGPLDKDRLPVDTTVWLRLADGPDQGGDRAAG